MGRAAPVGALPGFAAGGSRKAHASRIALVLGAGGSRGAYEAGVLAHLFEEIYPELPPGFEFDIVSGTSVGALHAAYLAGKAHEPAPLRASRLLSSWSKLQLSDVLRARDLVAFPLRALGVLPVSAELAALERVVRDAIPWRQLSRNLAQGRAPARCVCRARTWAPGRLPCSWTGPSPTPRPGRTTLTCARSSSASKSCMCVPRARSRSSFRRCRSATCSTWTARCASRLRSRRRCGPRPDSRPARRGLRGRRVTKEETP